MVRPQRKRFIQNNPYCTYFKPQGIRLKDTDSLSISLEEYETIRLKDYEKLNENKASEQMKISQPTFNRLYCKTKEKIAKAIIEGLAIKIEGGNYKMPNRDATGPEGKGPKTGRGLGNCDPNTENSNIDTTRPRRINRRRNLNNERGFRNRGN